MASIRLEAIKECEVRPDDLELLHLADSYIQETAVERYGSIIAPESSSLTTIMSVVLTGLSLKREPREKFSSEEEWIKSAMTFVDTMCRTFIREQKSLSEIKNARLMLRGHSLKKVFEPY